MSLHVACTSPADLGPVGVAWHGVRASPCHVSARILGDCRPIECLSIECLVEGLSIRQSLFSLDR